MPDKAIDVLDEAGARAKLRYRQENSAEPTWQEAVENWKRTTEDEEKLLSLEIGNLDESFFAVEVSRADVEEVIARWTGIPVQTLKSDEAKNSYKSKPNYIAASLLSVRQFRHWRGQSGVRARD